MGILKKTREDAYEMTNESEPQHGEVSLSQNDFEVICGKQKVIIPWISQELQKY